VRYLAALWDRPSYDWWEENIGRRHTSTLAALFGGLAAAAQWSVLDEGTRELAGAAAAAIRSAVLTRGVDGGRFTKWLDGDGLDASLIACATPFALVRPADPLIGETVRVIEARLARGGVHRYPEDSYYGGGEWLLLSALLGWHYVEAGRTDDARAQLEWVAAQATLEGYLPEQVDGHLLAPGAREGWVRRWGPVATPLLWSHAMFLTLALELGAVHAPIERP
jgi:GH15 family glucan-1,4-alpha-glucosidase